MQETCDLGFRTSLVAYPCWRQQDLGCRSGDRPRVPWICAEGPSQPSVSLSATLWSSAREHGPVSPAAVDLGPSVHATLWDLGQVALCVQVSVPYL